MIDCNKQALMDFFVEEKGFSLDRVESAVERINQCKDEALQRRVHLFFQVQSVVVLKKIKDRNTANRGDNDKINIQTIIA